MARVNAVSCPRFFRSLTGRLVLGVLALGLLLGTLLISGGVYLVIADYKAQFVNYVRAQSYVTATLFGKQAGHEDTGAILDDILLSGQVVDAQFVPAGTAGRAMHEDFFFNERGDGVYHMSMPVRDAAGETLGTLYLGYDEGYVLDRINKVYRRSVYLAAAYTGVLLLLVGLLGVTISRPLRRLRAASREIAAGHLDTQLAVGTPLVEIAELAVDLESMRHELIVRGDDIAVREARYRAVLENAAEGVLTLDREGRIESFNRAAENMFGYTTDEVLGTPFTRFIDSADVNRCVNPDGEPRTLNGLALIARRKNGDALHLLLSISAFLHGTDKVFTVVMQDISERVLFEERLAQLAYYDPLTGLPNRRLFHDRLGQALHSAERHDKLVAILFLDLDRFKQVNDTLGHLCGDLLLQAVAKRLAEVVRKEDTLARLGGDEFTIVLSDISNVQDAATVAQKIIDIFVAPFHLGEHEVFISTSIGVTFYPFDDNDIENLIKNADSAMYQAKANGRNTYEFYSAKVHSDAVERTTLEMALRKSLNDGDLTVSFQPQVRVHYQPQVDRFSGQIVGAEALMRWQHPTLGLIYPERFIPIAEETGLIIPLGEWILRAACEQHMAWRAAGLPSLRVSVNLSMRQLQHPGIVQQVASVLEETGIDPAYLELEITETMILHNVQEVAARLNEFKAMGILISIDDFGTGHSSLANLHALPIDEVKIDKSFVHNLTNDAQSDAIVSSSIEMAHRRGLRVVAEGVEMEEQLVYLHAQACDLMQGYYFSRPLAAADFESLLVREIQARDPLAHALI